MNKFSTLMKTGLLLASLVAVRAFAGEIVIQFAEPDWIFIQAPAVYETSAQITQQENEFARSIRPLLEKRDYQAITKAFESRPLNDDSAALKLLRGQVYISEKKYSSAEKALKSALQDMPDLALAHRSLSMVYMLQKDYAKAQVHLSRSIELGVADAQLFGQLAYVNLQNNRPFAAIAGYQRAMYLAPDNPQWQQGMLYVLIQSHAWAQASALLEQQLEIKPDDPQLWLMRSQIAMQQQRNEQALINLEAAIRMGESDTANLLAAVSLHLQHGSASRAVSLLKMSIENVGREQSMQVFEALDQIIPWLLHEGNEQGAATLLKAAESIKSEVLYQAKLNLYRGQLAQQQNQLTNAMRYLHRAAEQDPALGEALLVLAKVYQQQNKVQQAEMYYVRASALSDVRQRALLSHAQLQIDQKNYQQALDLLHKVLRNAPNRRDIQHNIRELQQLVRQDQYAS